MDYTPKQIAKRIRRTGETIVREEDMTPEEIIKETRLFCQWFETSVETGRIYSEANSSTIAWVRKLRRMIEEYESGPPALGEKG